MTVTRLSEANTILAKEIIGRYPKARSATIPLLHLSQQQNGYVTDEAMAHIAELVGATPAEVMGTATFYEMFKFQPVGKYLVNICGTMSCQLLGADELMHHAEQRLGVKAGGTTADGLITLEHAECQAACTEAPNLQVNYRHCHRMTTESFDQLVDDLRAGRLDGEIPPHGTLARVRQIIPAEKSAGVASLDAPVVPAWMPEAAQ
jgi:NADH-quinone oxidoreductase subunit E